MEPIDINEIDTSFYVLSVDLWSAEGGKEVNLVRHSATSPSISAATATSYPPPATVTTPFPYGPPMTQMHVGLAPNYGQGQSSNGAQSQYQPYSSQQQQQQTPDPYSHHHAPNNAHQPQAQQTSYHPPGGPQGNQPSHHQQQQQQQPPPPPQQSYYTTNSGTPITPTSSYYPQPGAAPLQSPHTMMPPAMDPRSPPSGMFTRNLIGSLSVSAFKLTDTGGELGIWFILQDLSVRTEGSFRLKMNFVDVSSLSEPQNVNKGSAPVLAATYSKAFQVYSAKKFPGVVESTPLSKCFATQGIKIPIRKDGSRTGQNGNRGDDDDEE
ncbi:hypothetical protein MMC25_007090 [Agyrium rufum]|nr:hypothetical protein [Agyrium rufum]